MPVFRRIAGESASESRTTSGFDGSHCGRRDSSGDCIWRPHCCVKGLKGSDEGGGCSSAAVARERVSCREDSEDRRCRRGLFESCVFVAAIEGKFELFRRESAGQSHGSVNWSESVVGVLKASLRSFRPAARASIS
jgi:hypothetical protein